MAEAGKSGCNVSDDECVSCTKLELADNIAAYLENRELIRDTEALVCDNSLVDKVICNYIIAKQIISNLSWQDKMLCKHVCTMWNSAVHALKKEQLSPEDFVMDTRCFSKRDVSYKKSGEFYTEPLVVFTFVNETGLCMVCKCESLVPSPCNPPCGEVHSALDLLQQRISMPKDCMLTIRASFMSYMPLPQTSTFDLVETAKNDLCTFMDHTRPFLAGIYIPMIPNVQFHTINIKSDSDMQKDFYDIVNKISITQIFKGIIVFVTDKYLLNPVDEIVFLNHFKVVQPDDPYAFGGCIIEDTSFEQSDIHQLMNCIYKESAFISENLVSIGVFTVPKIPTNICGEKCNFDMFSLVIESSDWSKPKILQTITQFSKEVPRFEHSVALKLSCVGRDQKHEIEQDYFRTLFPNTRIIGCYGNGELGVNHPAKPTSSNTRAPKRHRYDPGPQYGIMYSYSTVFVYIGWGAIL